MRQSDGIDLTCAEALASRRNIVEPGAELFQRLPDIASGEPSRSETHGCRQQESIAWQIGVLV